MVEEGVLGSHSILSDRKKCPERRANLPRHDAHADLVPLAKLVRRRAPALRGVEAALAVPGAARVGVKDRGRRAVLHAARRRLAEVGTVILAKNDRNDSTITVP